MPQLTSREKSMKPHVIKTKCETLSTYSSLNNSESDSPT